MSSTVKGVKITLISEIICKILDVPNEGLHLFNDDWFSEYDTDQNTFASSITKDHTKKIVASNLEPLSHILHNISIHTILPRAGSFEKESKQEILVIYHLSRNIPITLIYLFLNFIKYAFSRGGSTLYGMFLTQIFKRLRITLENEYK